MFVALQLRALHNGKIITHEECCAAIFGQDRVLVGTMKNVILPTG